MDNKSDLYRIKAFGRKADVVYEYIFANYRGKLDDEAIEEIFVGYDNKLKRSRLYTEEKSLIRGRIVIFIETANSNKGNYENFIMI